ncbi:hypothetical protein ACFOLL_12980 [Falsochrobactrum ovis]|uniref:Putative phiE125 gp8 family phage protein n=1 Tax=Falsochrobactrum ovis TaxID=1293442 RepID=A0A364JTI9_9HYPH|nr:hypothetical protein [Falsochrobactrum ovis]RAK27102.1 putative phiE125 gp8 family phage protein [Falsochrobactrum ovis]
MHRPILVAPSTKLPVSIEEVMLALRIEEVELETEIESQIKAAVAYYEGWGGILGISILEQEWRQDYDRFERELCLPVGPVLSKAISVTWRNPAGQVSTVPPSSYALRVDSAGRATIRFDAGYQLPTDLHESGAVSVTYWAGYDPVPEDIKSAIKLRVQMMMDEAAQANLQHLERAENALLQKYRRMDV